MTVPGKHPHIGPTGENTPSPLSMRLLPLAAIALAVISVLFGSTACDDEHKEVIAGSTDPETTPTMTTTDVSTLVSDSGITRYRITSPLWLMFEEAKDPTWRFPQGIHLEKFNLAMRPEATIDCDSATYFKNRQLWRLDGYVNIRNTLGEKFLTNQLFWDQRQQKIYSDSFIHIERQNKVIEGYGFESNENMTRYNVLRVSGIFPADQFKSDSTKRAQAMASLDSTAAGAPGAAPANPAVPHTIVKGDAPAPKIKDRSDNTVERARGSAVMSRKPLLIDDKKRTPSPPGRKPLSN